MILEDFEVFKVVYLLFTIREIVIALAWYVVYHEEESIYNQVTLEENNTALKELKQEAEEEAVANGLLDNARSNAETILTGFFGQVYDLDQYKIVYKDK